MGVHERARDRGERFLVLDVGKPVHVNWTPDAGGQSEFLLDESVKTFERRTAAGEDDAGMQPVEKILIFKFVAYDRKEFLQSEIDDSVKRAS